VIESVFANLKRADATRATPNSWPRFAVHIAQGILTLTLASCPTLSTADPARVLAAYGGREITSSL
jgi:hypothetical protein